ncbi:MAG TPA: RNA polymerase sigma factor [Acidobacteriaceae bacterium]|jgi:RNA polymerase sigma-70 factor (ECF subfamily)|nr:RNA polymerase sigma factor [Acidobacteriaceae bacterium]
MHATHASSVLRFTGKERAASELDDIDQLVERHRSRLLRFVAFSVGDQDLAQSIVQDCFMKAYNARETFRGECSIQTWLNRIALNMILDHQRTQKFRFWRSFRKTALDITEIASSLPSKARTPEKSLLMQERVAQVAKALESLSFNQRTIFLMHFQEEMNIPEISLAIDMSVNTVKTHLHRAVKAVREKIGEMK